MSNASPPIPMSFIGLFVCILLMLIFIPHLGRIAGKLAFVMGISRGREGMASASSSTTAFIAPDGSTAVFSDGNIIVTPVDETKTESIYHAVHGERNVFTNNDGGKVVVTRASGSDGGKAVSIAVTDGNGNAAVIYAAQGENGNTASTTNSTTNSSSNYDHYDHYNKSSSPVIFYGPDGGTAKMGIASDGQRTIMVTSHAGQTTIYYLDTSNPDANVYKSSSGATITVVAANGTTTLSIRTVQGEVYVYTDTNSYSYDFPDEGGGGGGGGDVTAYSGNNVSAVSGPAGNTAITTNTGGSGSGIPRSAIPPGDEDLYMLKSEALVPICPKCEPVVIEKSTCQPCPAPARCPEPQFECTKTYTAKSLNSTIAPVPVMSDFSSFGR